MNDHKPCEKCGATLPVDAPGGVCPACLLQLGMSAASGVASAVGSGVEATEGFSASAPSASRSPFAPEPAISVAELQSRFPNLEFIELLGRGGMGAVYKARQIGLDRLIAVKILPRQVSEHPSFAERFTREARALARLNHPHIVSVFDFGEKEGLFYFLMEYVDGLNLRQMLHAGEMAPAAALAIVPQICEALQYAHDEGVVHRDIKPENILIDKRGRVKIADFGLAKMLGAADHNVTLTGTHQVMGTFHYMAPEQVEKPQSVDHRADIYALGVVFYELLTHELPLGRFPLPSQKVQVDVRLDEIVLRSLEKEPARRYQHASQVKTEVESVANSPRAATGRRERPPQFNRPAESAGAAVAAIPVAEARRALGAPATGLQVAGAIAAAPMLVVVAGAIAAFVLRILF